MYGNSCVIKLSNRLLSDLCYLPGPTTQTNGKIGDVCRSDHVPRGDYSAPYRRRCCWTKKGLEADLRRDRRRPQEIKIDVHTLAQLNAAVGGAAAPQGRNAGRNFPDYGPLLVQLIQDTISPSSWDVNGGKSTIVYYRLGRALVVRAPQSLHGAIGPLLGQLQGP